MGLGGSGVGRFDGMASSGGRLKTLNPKPDALLGAWG